MNLVRLQYGGGSSIEPYTVIVSLDENFEGQPVTLTQGTEIMRKTCPKTAPYEVEFKPMNDGVWVASSTTKDGNVVSADTKPLLEWGTYNVTLKSGFYFQEWLNLGRVEKTFTSLDDVLADQPIVRQLMTVHASCDYLYKSYLTDNTILDTIMNSTYGAKWIGLRDYICDKFMANETAKATMLNSNNWEYILKDKVPIMTSNTAPYGTALRSTIDGNQSKFEAFYAFDNDDSTYWAANSGATNQYIGYEFAQTVCVKKLYIKCSDDTVRLNKFILQGSNDGFTTKTDIETFENNSVENTFNVNNNDYYKSYRIYGINDGSGYFKLVTLQFYGRSLNVSVPNMSDNTTPYGECKASSVVDRQPYKSFTKVGENENWYTTKITNQWLEYDFNKPVCIKAFSVYNVYAPNGNPSIKNYELQYYDKVSNTWNPASKKVLFPSTGTVVVIPTIPSIISDKYRVFVYDSYNNNFIQFSTNFYGVDYTERDFEVESGVLTNRVKYIYDHGVEVVPLTKTATSVLANVDKESKKLLRAKAGYHATNLDKLQRGSGFSTFSVGTEPNNWYLDISSLGGTLSTGFSQVSDTTDIECWME